jgi:hypothetical protein
LALPTVASMKLGADLTGFALSPMVQAIKAMYRMGAAVHEYVDAHIEAMKSSDNTTIASSGRALEAAKFGFGLGYTSAVAIMAVGQLLLGNPLAAIGVVVSSAVLSNPIAMTCAAVGAIYFGWDALTEKEKDGILDRLSLGLSLGIELIRSVIDFVIRTTRSLLSSKQLLKFKEFIRAQALLFGKSLYDVTGKVGDLVKDAVETIGDLGTDAVDATRGLVKDAYEAASSAANAGKKTAGRLGASITEGFESGRLKTQRVLGRFDREKHQAIQPDRQLDRIASSASKAKKTARKAPMSNATSEPKRRIATNRKRRARTLP